VFDSIQGNDQAKKYLQTMLLKGAIANSYLFAGTPGAQFAKALAAELLQDFHRVSQGSHPDLHEYRPEGKVAMHSIDTLRQFAREVHMNPLEAPWKIFIIHDADRMLPTSANALLKTFEEPPPGSLILLLTNRPESLLPTILSRCQKVYFEPNRALQTEPPYKEKLLSLLNTSHFSEVQQIAKEIETTIEEQKNTYEAEARAELLKLDAKDLSATARESLEKEVAGVYSLRFHEEVDRLLEIILTSPKGRQNLERTLALVEEAKVKVQRFMPISHVLESLFFKLEIS